MVADLDAPTDGSRGSSTMPTSTIAPVPTTELPSTTASCATVQHRLRRSTGRSRQLLVVGPRRSVVGLVRSARRSSSCRTGDRSSTSPNGSSGATTSATMSMHGRSRRGKSGSSSLWLHGSALLRDGVTRSSTIGSQHRRSVKSASGVLDTLFGALCGSDSADAGRASARPRDRPRPRSLAETTPLTRQAILKHLQVLEAAGLAAHERAGREVRYRVTPQPLASAVGWILDTAGQWDSRIDRLRRLDSERLPLSYISGTT